MLAAPESAKMRMKAMRWACLKLEILMNHLSQALWLVTRWFFNFWSASSVLIRLTLLKWWGSRWLKNISYGETRVHKTRQQAERVDLRRNWRFRILKSSQAWTPVWIFDKKSPSYKGLLGETSFLSCNLRLLRYLRCVTHRHLNLLTYPEGNPF